MDMTYYTCGIDDEDEMRVDDHAGDFTCIGINGENVCLSVPTLARLVWDLSTRLEAFAAERPSVIH